MKSPSLADRRGVAIHRRGERAKDREEEEEAAVGKSIQTDTF